MFADLQGTREKSETNSFRLLQNEELDRGNVEKRVLYLMEQKPERRLGNV